MMQYGVLEFCLRQKTALKKSHIYPYVEDEASVKVKYLSLSGIESLPLSLPSYAFLFLFRHFGFC